jgi:hypothetical protein
MEEKLSRILISHLQISRRERGDYPAPCKPQIYRACRTSDGPTLTPRPASSRAAPKPHPPTEPAFRPINLSANGALRALGHAARVPTGPAPSSILISLAALLRISLRAFLDTPRPGSVPRWRLAGVKDLNTCSTLRLNRNQTKPRSHSLDLQPTHLPRAGHAAAQHQMTKIRRSERITPVHRSRTAHRWKVSSILDLRLPPPARGEGSPWEILAIPLHPQKGVCGVGRRPHLRLLT